MARPRQPVELLLYKGKKNLTKQEIEERKSQEVKAASDKVKPPSYLPKDLKREFKKIADELLRIGIMSNLDIDALARFLLAKKMYLQVTEKLLDTEPTLTAYKVEKDDEGNIISKEPFTISNETYSDLLINQDKLFKQCRAAASDLGLTISSRCKLVIPKKEEKEPTEFDRKFGEV
jgi:P27 family predicted phage terminase small subunit